MAPLRPGHDPATQSCTQRPTAGPLTAQMRAVPHAAERNLLRVGLMIDGRILDERLVGPGSKVTVGQREDCTFVVRADWPLRFTLFERRGNATYLNFVERMSGRLGLADGLADLGALTVTAARAGDVYRLRLTEGTRGAIAMGGVTVLFQFVAPPPLRPKPQLPLSVKTGLADQIDWNLAIIAAFTFLLHFGWLGTMYSDWADPVVDSEITARFIGPSVPDPVPLIETASAPPEAPAPAPPAESPPARASRAAPVRATDPGARAELIDQAALVRLALVTAVTPGANLKHVLDSDTGAPVDLGELARRSTGVTEAPGLLLGMPAGEPIDPRRSDRWDDLVGERTSEAPDKAGRPRVVVPSFEMHQEPVSISVPMSDAEAVIRTSIAPGARRCYQRSLSSNPTQSGKLVLLIEVAASGEVTSARAAGSAGLSRDVAECISAAALRAKFSPPAGGRASLSVPFNFVRQGP